MNLEVYITSRAEQQLRDAADWYARQSHQIGQRWFDEIMSAIHGLAENPLRHSLARESGQLPIELRELRFGLGKRVTHRILYVVRPDKIVVHHIRHVAQDDISLQDI